MLTQKKKSHLVISIKLFTQYFWFFSFMGKCENPKADFSAQLPETASAIRCLKRKFNNCYDQSVSLLLPSHSRHLFLLILGLCHPFRLTFGAFCRMCFYNIWDKPPPAHQHTPSGMQHNSFLLASPPTLNIQYWLFSRKGRRIQPLLVLCSCLLSCFMELLRWEKTSKTIESNLQDHQPNLSLTLKSCTS